MASACSSFWPAGDDRHATLITLSAALAAVAVLYAAAIAVGALDRQVITEAGKSLSYRWQYWMASLNLIRGYPWAGCGPGNFQGSYTRYKLPEASEVVADPHNFLIRNLGHCGHPCRAGAAARFSVVSAGDCCGHKTPRTCPSQERRRSI